MTVTLNSFTGKYSDVPQPTTVQGQNGWWTLPRQWFVKAYDGGANQLIASPNSDFSGPNYVCILDDSGQQYAFQDLLRTKTAGMDNPYGTTLGHP